MEAVIESDESLIEGRIVEAVEANTVADVEALGLVAAPWQDVGGDEEFAHWQSSDGATAVVVVENDVAEIVLPAALFGDSGGFGLALGRPLAGANAGAWNDLGGLATHRDSTVCDRT
jgi:hypothetical protein